MFDEGIEYDRTEIIEWFEGFETELRERIMDVSCGRKPNRTECWTIKEILGE